MTISVFITDDHTIIRDGLVSLISQEDDITIAGTSSSGRDTLKQLLKLKPDIILMDISMPELNGIETIARVKKNNPAIKVIFLSMHENSEYIYKAFSAGGNGYLLKESAGIEVIQAIRSVYHGKRYLSSRIEEIVLDDYFKDKYLNQSNSPLDKLSDKELDVLKMVVEGKSSKNIAAILFVSPKTVDTYRSRIMQKLSITNIPSLVKFAIQHGLTDLDS